MQAPIYITNFFLATYYKVTESKQCSTIIRIDIPPIRYMLKIIETNIFSYYHYFKMYINWSINKIWYKVEYNNEYNIYLYVSYNIDEV